MTWTMAIETGGTFTDLFVVSPEGQVFADKIPSTPEAPAQAAAQAFQRGTELAGIEAGAVSRLLHGSTIAVNALIERRSAMPAMIATRGFRDMLFIGRQEKLHIYDMAYRKPDPFTDRANVYEVAERIGPDGEVAEALDEAEVAALADRIIDETGASTIAVCLLHAYANPVHERALADIISARHPDVEVVLSSDVCPVHREFERASTTIINAYLHPVVNEYLGRFAQVVKEAGCIAEPLIMQANGGVLPVQATRQRPAGLYLSGPSAAVSGAASLARQANLPSLITLDVGGTSTDICLVTEGEVHETGHGGAFGRVQGQPLNMVMTDIVTIGAGGGSIAWIDDGGMLKVGPQSAGADPGPACYGRAGNDFTLTDAMLCLGLLQDGASLPGGIVLSRTAAVAAAGSLQEALGLDLLALAQAVYRIAIANMAEAIRSVTVRRGYDPRDYVLFACGGAGPMMAAPLAEELEVGGVLVPPDPGVFSAFGLTASGVRMDFASAIEADGAAIASPEAFEGLLRDMTARADAAFAAVDANEEELNHTFSADVRYAGQGFELRVPLERERCREAGAAYLADCFHDVHAQRFGHAFPEQRIEVTALRLTAASAPASSIAHWQSSPSGVAGEDRTVSAGGEETQAAVIDRAGIDKDAPTSGPALFAEPTTTTWVPPKWRARSDQFGLLHLEREGG